jgi:hypothetical protein
VMPSVLLMHADAATPCSNMSLNPISTLRKGASPYPPHNAFHSLVI